MPGMELVRIIREKLGLNPWNMSKKLNKKSIQAYLTIERTSKKISLSDLVQLKSVSQMDLSEFWDLVESQAKKERKDRSKKES